MSSSQSLPRLIALLVLAAAAAVVGLIATGNLPGFAKEDAEARALLERALGSDGSAPKSGRFSGNFALQFNAKNAQIPPITMQVTGAFSEGATKEQRKFALDSSVSAAGQSFNFGMISTGRQAFMRFGGNHYEVPRSQLRQAYDERTMNSGRTLAALGLDPGAWIEGVRGEGSADVGGVPTTHVSADVKVSKLVDDLVALGGRLAPGQASNVPTRDQTDELKHGIKNAKLDAYIGTADGVVRRVTLHARIDASDGSGEINADFTISDVDKPQRISAPAITRPFSELQRDLGSGSLQSALGAAPPPGGGSAPPPSVDSGTPAKAPPADDKSYLGCVRKAATAAALQRCSSLLP